MSVSSRPSFLLFRLAGGSLSATPELVQPTSYEPLGALEVQHVEQWIASAPDVLGERLLVLSRQFDKFDKTKNRSDILALDEAGCLVVVELKRAADPDHDLQALRYAGYCARFRVEDAIDLFVEHRKSIGQPLSADEARLALEDHVIEGALENLDEDLKPRIILVSSSFRVEVTSTCLWLREQYLMDITCIQLIPYVVAGELVLASSVLIPLPEASEYTVQRDRKLQKAKSGKGLDWSVARNVMASIPPGHWVSYQDLAVAAGGSPKAGMAVGMYLAATTDMPAGVHRVLRANGTISPGWKGSIGGPEECKQLLESEGLAFDDKGRADISKRFDFASVSDAPEGGET